MKFGRLYSMAFVCCGAQSLCASEVDLSCTLESPGAQQLLQIVTSDSSLDTVKKALHEFSKQNSEQNIINPRKDSSGTLYQHLSVLKDLVNIQACLQNKQQRELDAIMKWADELTASPQQRKLEITQNKNEG